MKGWGGQFGGLPLVDMGLEVEHVERRERASPVAQYVRDYGYHWEMWLQHSRVELNAMTTPDFIAWLNRKMVEQDGAT